MSEFLFGPITTGMVMNQHGLPQMPVFRVDSRTANTGIESIMDDNGLHVAMKSASVVRIMAAKEVPFQEEVKRMVFG